jgi:hypothetical protein
VGVSALLLVLVAGELFPNGLGPIDTGAPASASVRACAGCHADVHADWSQSRHGQAWTNPIFQREYKDRPLAWCVHCHAPLREQLAEVQRGGGSLAAEGITCAACHIRDGKMLARRRGAASPHATEARADFGGPAYCAGCHQFNFPVIAAAPPGPGKVVGYTAHPMQDTARQHAAGPRAAQECLGCHRSGAGGHRFPGGHDAEMLGRAVALETCRDGDRLQVHLTNAGAGHNVPTGDLHRHLVLRVWRADAPERLQEVVLGRRFAVDEAGGKRTTEDTTIPAGETRVVSLPLGDRDQRSFAATPLSVELRLVYTIDEFPFRGREVAEPTWATMLTREVSWVTLRDCKGRGRRAPLSGPPASSDRPKARRPGRAGG